MEKARLSSFRRARLLTAAALLTLFTAAAPCPAQGPTLRLDLPGAPYPGTLRPEAPAIARQAVVPLGANLEHLTFLGNFSDRFGRDPAALPGKLDLDGREHPRAATALYAATDGRTLRLEVRCQESEPGSMKSDFDFYFPDDRIEVHLDPAHDHHRFERIALSPGGRLQQWAYTVAENHLSPDRAFREDSSHLKVNAAAHLDTGGWTARFDISLPDTLRSAADWTVLGLNVARYRAVHGEETSLWCPDSNRAWAPLYFGDLYLGAPPALVQSVELGALSWGENSGRLVFAPGAALPRKVSVGTLNYQGVFEEKEYTATTPELAFGFEIDPHELMRSAVVLRLDGREWGRYILGWKRGLLLTHNPTGGFSAPRPLPGEPDYQWKLARYVLDRLPAFRRSPDGLTLLSGDSLRVDLRQADAFAPLAEIIVRRFADDDTRLIAAALILCQSGVMLSSGSGEKVNEPLGPTGTLRCGAAFCNSYADLLCELIRHLPDSAGQPFKAAVLCYKDGPANTWGWPHHWVAGASYRGGLTLLDAELGVFFVNPENGRLATLSELLAHPEWADSSAHGLSEYFRGRPATDFGVRESGDLWMLE
ncbi:hypothetical protein LLH00_16940 [bacterium]|nr:hypothetical protein [bacterium]